MKVVFFGTPAAAVPTLQALVGSRHEVILVVTQPDRAAGRSRRPAPPAIALEAVRWGLPAIQPERLRGDGIAATVGRVAPDVLVVVAYGRILPRGLIELAPRGAINVHFSLLPAYRGAAPVQWALARGERRTGVTTMLINERLDEGDLLLEREVEILEREHAPALGTRLATIGAELLLETLDALETGAVTPLPQPTLGVSFAPALTPQDGSIDPTWSAREIEGRVRGFDPWPGAWVRAGERRLRLVEATASDRSVAAEPGRVLALAGDGLLVACGAGSVLTVHRLQPEGRRIIGARDAINGRVLALGDLLTR